MASLLDLEAPRQQAERVGAVHREEAPAVVRDLAELALLDQLRDVAHERRPAVVVTHTGDHARLPGGALRAHRLLRRAADRLLAEHVLAGRAGRLDQLDVEHVRRRDHHDVDVRVVHDPAPVLRALLEPERPHRVLGARRHGVGADHQPGVELAVLEQRRDAQHRTAVGLAQPAEADHRDAELAAGASARRDGPQRLRRVSVLSSRRSRDSTVADVGALHWNAPTECQPTCPLCQGHARSTPRERRRGADSTGRWSRARSDAARRAARGRARCGRSRRRWSSSTASSPIACRG